MASGLGTETDLQGDVMRARLARITETRMRNQANQEAVVIKKANEKKRKAKVRGERNMLPQTQDRKRFYNAIDEPIALICASCGELSNPQKMTVLTYDKKDRYFEILATPDLPDMRDGLVPEAIVTKGRKRSVPICDTCLASLRQNKVPRSSAASGFQLCPVPVELTTLNSIESRLIGLGVCFTSCYNLVGDGQECTRGNAINFWNDAYKVVSSLPRPIAKCGIVRIKCKGDARVARVVKVIHTVFEDHNVSTRRSKRVLLMAHHGTAAFNIKGSTICSALGIPRLKGRGYEEQYKPLTQTRSGTDSLRRLQQQYAAVHMVIIDEYSVISCAMLHWIDERMKEIWPDCRDLPFGGRDVILAGDLGQLNPVIPAALSTPYSELTNTNQKAGRMLWEGVSIVCNLTGQNRGRLDPEWYAALARLRKMEQTEEDLRLFNSRYNAPIMCSAATKFIAYTNEDVDNAITTFLSRQSNTVYELHARHTVEPVQRDAEVSRRLIDAMDDLLARASAPSSSRDRTVPPRLSLAIGCPVALTINLEQSAGLCNGTKAIVHGFMATSSTDIPVVLVRILDKYLGPSFIQGIPNIVPIAPHSLSWTTKGIDVRTRRRGLPLRLAYAMTVHKVQGLTCDSVIFDPTDIPSSAFAYVGLSRVRERKDLSLWRVIQFKESKEQSRTKRHLSAEWARLESIDTQGRAANANIVARFQQLAEIVNSCE